MKIKVTRIIIIDLFREEYCIYSLFQIQAKKTSYMEKIKLASNTNTTPNEQLILLSAITNPSQMSIILGAHKRKVSTETSEVIFLREKS